jgi:hypothetical protein
VAYPEHTQNDVARKDKGHGRILSTKPQTIGVKLLNTTTLPNGDQQMTFDLPSGSPRLFWQIVVF